MDEGAAAENKHAATETSCRQRRNTERRALWCVAVPAVGVRRGALTPRGTCRSPKALSIKFDTSNQIESKEIEANSSVEQRELTRPIFVVHIRGYES
jgi:hypothetical protein